jgi:septal ring factor EnvC (AmiA/AmiB activator)
LTNCEFLVPSSSLHGLICCVPLLQIGPEDAERLRTLEKDIAAAEKELQKLNSLSQGLQQKAADLQKKMDDAGGPQLKAKRAAVERLQKVGHYQGT